MKRHGLINHTYGSYLAIIVIVALTFWTFGINTAKAEGKKGTDENVIELSTDLNTVNVPIAPILITGWIAGSNVIPMSQYTYIDTQIGQILQDCPNCVALIKGGNSTEPISGTCYWSADHSHYTLKTAEKMPYDQSARIDKDCNEHLSLARAKAIELYLVNLSNSGRYKFNPGQLQPTTLTGTNMYGADHAINRGVAVLIINTERIVQWNIETLKKNSDECKELQDFFEIPAGCWVKVWNDEEGNIQSTEICKEEERELELSQLFAQMPEQSMATAPQVEQTPKGKNGKWKKIALYGGGALLIGGLIAGLCIESKVEDGDPSVKSKCW